MSNGKRFIDVLNLNASTMSILGMIGFFIWVSIVGTNLFNELKSEHIIVKEQIRIEALDEYKKIKDEIKDIHDQIIGTENQINEVLLKMKEKVDAIHERQRFVLENIWTKQAHSVWCRETEVVNSNWKCPTYQELVNKGLLGHGERFGINSSEYQKMIRDLQDPDKLWIPPKTRHPGNAKP